MEKKFNLNDVSLIVGLGNPGNEYEGTYHNVGWSMVDVLAAGTSFRGPRGKRFSFVRLLGGIPVVKPRTFMNESGSAAKEALTFFSLRTSSHLLVIHDDSDLPLGTWKLQFGRGAAGHKGVASIIATLGTKDFWRIRVGIRPPERSGARQKAGAFVLARPSGKKAALLTAAYAAIAAALSHSPTAR
jgi:PTH1 family peptidyl-tRNA hydrolase